MVLDFKTSRDKVLGCWMGKNIGGVLGAPLEGIRQFNDDVEILSGKEIMLPLNNLWGACAEAEFEFNADFYPSAKLELLVDVQLEGRHSYGVVKVVVTRKG